MTSADWRTLPTDPEELDKLTREAVRNFRDLVPTLNSFVKVLTGKTVTVRMHASSNGHTDGKHIYMRPPLMLGFSLRHQRNLCDKRDRNTLQQRCAACAQREHVMTTIYHEISHIWFGTLDKVTDYEFNQFVQRLKQTYSGKYADNIVRRLDQIQSVGAPRSFMDLATMVNAYFPFLVNAVEDGRVDKSMAEARRGVRLMQQASILSTLDEGFETVNDEGVVETKRWKDNEDLNSQLAIALYSVILGVDPEGRFHSKVLEALADIEMQRAIERLRQSRSAAGAMAVTFDMLVIGRNYGFFREADEEEPPPPPDPQPQAEPEPDEEQSESDDPDDGDDGSSDEPTPDDADGTAPESPEDAQDGPPEPQDGPGADDADPDADDATDGPETDTHDADTDDDTTQEGDKVDDGAPTDEPEESDGEPADSADDGEGEDDSDQEDADSDGSDQDDSDDDGSSDQESGGDEGAGSSGPDEPDDDDSDDSDSDEGPSSSDLGDESGDDSGDARGTGSETDPGADGDAPDDRGPDAGDDDSGDTDSDEDGLGDDPDHDAGQSEGLSRPGDSGSAGHDPGRDDTIESGDEGDLTDDEGDSEDDDSDSDDESDDEDSTGDGTPGGDARGRAGSSSDGDPSGSDDAGSDPASEGSLDRGTESPADDPASDDEGTDEGARPDGGQPSEDGEPTDGEPTLGREGWQEEGQPEMTWGSPEEMRDAFDEMSHHGEHSDEETAPEADLSADEKDQLEEIMGLAIEQAMYFDTSSRDVFGCLEFVTGPSQLRPADLAWVNPRVRTEYYKSEQYPESNKPSEVVMGPALQRLRRALSDNRMSGKVRDLRAGRVNVRSLGGRAWSNDDRLFYKKTLPATKDYVVLIGLDMSGSTTRGEVLQLIKDSARAQADLCSRLGIPFMMYAHTGVQAELNGQYGRYLCIFKIKEIDQPWDAAAIDRLGSIRPLSANLDGHTLEYYRKRLDEVRTKKTRAVLMYYTDGAMPAENYEEELEILQREIKVCRDRDYVLVGVGIGNDDPTEHGLDTVRVDTERDVLKVVDKLKTRILQ